MGSERDVGSVGIVVGLSAEARIARRSGWPVAIGGGTAAGAERAAHTLVGSGARALISFGLAGGLDPALRSGDIVVPAAVLAGSSRFLVDPALARLCGGVTAAALLGGDSVVASVAAKQDLWRRTRASAVDLESDAVARVAAARRVPFAVLRAICDPAERALPPAALVALDAQGAIAAWRVLASLARRPTQLVSLVTLAADALAARRALLTRVNAWSAAPRAARRSVGAG